MGLGLIIMHNNRSKQYMPCMGDAWAARGMPAVGASGPVPVHVCISVLGLPGAPGAASRVASTARTKRAGA